MTKQEALDIILATKVIAVIRMPDEKKVFNVIEALEKGGVKALEVTMTTPGALEIVAFLSSRKTPGILVGAGTVLDVETATEAIRAGADFLVSPVTNFDMIRVCGEENRFVAPGALTPTEILAAWQAGADVVKVFPASSLGPRYFKDLKGPLPQVRLMPTGGVTLENARQFIESGACCVAIGTALLDEKAIESEDWNLLTLRGRNLMDSLA
ncbi:MAG: bifunctional 4-hydroxy-2-oxoglutarate aldolase/2-dehydro-3-deoxy-phosphogluconate aldolase [Clostridiales bacterium]|nr:bifunctional 4-hydroxy-2-oxoglutarate aldolase/2-dehydro-3-deoxy-phosphogluconate aldolase [Clostridiales bacterium]